MDGSLIYGVVEGHGPLIPNLRVRVVAPDRDVNLLALVTDEGYLNWEIHWEPTVHTRSVLRRIGAVKDVLVEFCSEITTETMYLSLFLLNSENNFIKLFH